MRIATSVHIKTHSAVFVLEINKAMRKLIVGSFVILLAACTYNLQGGVEDSIESKNQNLAFDGQRAFQFVTTQVEFGPRIPGSSAHQLTGDWIATKLQSSGWDVEFQEFTYGEYTLKNIVARSTSEAQDTEPILLGAHYDTRLLADRDVSMPDKPVPGANDGASGVAVLLELANVLDLNAVSQPVWLVFFDAEDNGRIEGWDWVLGSRYFVDKMRVKPTAVVIVDMVGDADLQLYYEKNSDPFLRDIIWQTASELGYDQFIPQEKYSILDDHTPFLQAGITAVDIIDFDYPYYHTTRDIPDKVSAESLESVGRTIEVWLENSE